MIKPSLQLLFVTLALVLFALSAYLHDGAHIPLADRLMALGLAALTLALVF